VVDLDSSCLDTSSPNKFVLVLQQRVI
jgi:hypothetical protein